MAGNISSTLGAPNRRKSDDYVRMVPYEDLRETVACGHSMAYVLRLFPEQPAFCGLCLLREGFESEVPNRIHEYKLLAENGNPATKPRFLVHLVLIMGLEPPKLDEDLKDWRRHRTSLAREQYTARSPLPGHKLFKRSFSEKYSSPSRMFPVSSALWQLMGYQPPLGRVVIPAVAGHKEEVLAERLGISLWDVHVRMAKGIRTAIGFIPDDDRPESRSSLSLLRES